MSKCGLRTWVEINKDALRSNYGVFRGIIGGGCRLMAVVKSNAYGHGLVETSRFFEECDVDWLGVDSVVEGLALRRAGVKKPILVLGCTMLERFDDARRNDISVTISSFDGLESLKNLHFPHDRGESVGKEKLLRVHLKVDTGMHRQGFLFDEVPRAVDALGELERVEVEGIYSHFAAAVPSRSREAGEQIKRFQEVVDVVKSAGFAPVMHMAATGGTLCFPEARFDLVRVGIGMYGLWPSGEAKDYSLRVSKFKGLKLEVSEFKSFKGRILLRSALTWKTVVGEVKEIPEGSMVGYDWTEKVEKDSRIAVCPVGYWHGYPRSLSSVGEVLIRGKRAKVLGRVCMDMIIVDVTEVSDVRAGDEVVLLGRQGREEVSVDELAQLAGAINYEIVTRINPLVRRFYE